MENLLHLIVQAQAGDKQVRDALIEENLGLVHHIVKRYAGRGYDNEDLFQIGCIGLIKAVDHFDIGYDVKFSTYAVPLIMGEIRRFMRDNTMLKMPRSVKENAWKVSVAREELAKALGREPTIDEIMYQTHLTEEEIVLALEAPTEVESLSKPISTKDGSELTLEEKLPDQSDEEGKIVSSIFLEQLMEYLSEDEKYLIRLRYFDNKTQSETAKYMGITQVQVSRREKKILHKLWEKGHA